MTCEILKQERFIMWSFSSLLHSSCEYQDFRISPGESSCGCALSLHLILKCLLHFRRQDSRLQERTCTASSTAILGFETSGGVRLALAICLHVKI